MKLEVTEDLIRCMVALEDREEFQFIMGLMVDRAEGMAIWSRDLEHDTQLRWSQGRVQELTDWAQAWAHRRNWRDTLSKRINSGKMESMESGVF